MEQKNKNVMLLLALLFGILILNLFFESNISAETYCAETTLSLPNIGVMHCLDGLSLSQVDTNHLYSATSCDSTEYCRPGTCVNTIAGNCLSATQATCLPGEGGVFYTAAPSDVPSCQNGCCLLGEQASFTTSARCDVLASNAGVTKNFDATVTDESTCISMARPQAKGACVYETSEGRTCDFTTRQDCKDTGTFHEGFLCTNVDLETNCIRTTQTTCLDTSSQIFFIDTCGNPANVYNATLVDDINYWNYIADSAVGIANGVTVYAGDGAGNIGSSTNGNCNYQLGSTCMPYDRNIDTAAPASGDNICRNVNCAKGTFSELFGVTYGRTPYNGESWCGEATKDSVLLTSGNPGITSTDFLNYDKSSNLPGSTEVLFICANGRITTEINAQYRSKVCSQDTSANGYYGAAFVANRWQYCYYYNNNADCLNTELGDCKWITGASILKDEAGINPLVYDSTLDLLVSKTGVDDTRPEASCVPRYPPGFDPSTSGDATDLSSQTICGLASRTCYVNYSRGIAGQLTDFWYVSNNAGDLFYGTITCLTNDPDGPENESMVPEWEQNMTNLCMSLGDCGISINYAEREGSNTEKDLFKIVIGNTSGSNI